MSHSEATFDASLASRIFPRIELKHAVFVKIPRFEDGTAFVSYIEAEWGGVQQFLGDYYAIIKNGCVIYGSAKEQWRAMHHEVRPGVWIKTGVPQAYQVHEPCVITTLILNEDGTLKEARATLRAFDWIVRQPGGEVQHIKQEKFYRLYYTPDEVQEMKLGDMSDQEFASHVVACVSEMA